MRRVISTICQSFTVLLTLAMMSAATPTYADSATIRISIVKAGWIVGASGGSGTLTFQGKTYPLRIGGLSAGLTFGASKAELIGTVSNISRPSDIEGTYTQAQVGVAIAGGAKAAQLRNSKGVVLSVRGRQIGLEFSLDLSGLDISLK
jgi:hypothetical protein